MLSNISKCYCCKELEGCSEALDSDIVCEDIAEGQQLVCITQHNGFRPVCLEKCSLRFAVVKYHKKDKQAYKKTGSEERIVGGLFVSLRSFSLIRFFYYL